MPIVICRHILPSGRRCRAFACKGAATCYWHRERRLSHRIFHPSARQQRTDRSLRAARALPLPQLDGAAAVQLALARLITAIGQERVDLDRAGLLLYGLQIVSSNIRRGIAPGDCASNLSEV